MNCHARSSANPARSVSIHIRHCWRMNYYRLHVYMSTPACFNPHSPLLANELPARHGQAAGYRVSIHIRHCWRMNFGKQAAVSQGHAVSIHIRHCWRMNCVLQLVQKRIANVSIHIRHCWRMNCCNWCKSVSRMKLQPRFHQWQKPPQLPIQ